MLIFNFYLLYMITASRGSWQATTMMRVNHTQNWNANFGLDEGEAQCVTRMGAAYKGRNKKIFLEFLTTNFFPSLVDILPFPSLGLCILGVHNSSVANWVSYDFALVASRGRKHLRTVFVGPWVSWPAIKCMCSSQMIGHCRLLAVYHTND